MRPSITEGVKHLLIINIIMYAGMMLLGNNGELFMRWFALYFPKNELFQPWQVITHMFMHSNATFAHILFNMFALWMFGTAVEQFTTKLDNQLRISLLDTSGLNSKYSQFLDCADLTQRKFVDLVHSSDVPLVNRHLRSAVEHSVSVSPPYRFKVRF